MFTEGMIRGMELRAGPDHRKAIPMATKNNTSVRDRDSVLRHATTAAQNDSTEVRAALEYLLHGRVPLDCSIGSRDYLRLSLERQAAGVEPFAANGGTRAARVDAARAALAAWDGAVQS
jgi:hypothetical protein